MHRMALSIAALFLVAPATAQEVTSVLTYQGQASWEAGPGETIVLEGTVERLCPPGYLAGPAVTEVHVAAPAGFQVVADPPTFEQQVCTLEPSQASPLRLTVSVPTDANTSVTHAFTVWVDHPDQQPPYPPMTTDGVQTDLLVHVAGNESTEAASPQGRSDTPSAAIPVLGPAPLLLVLAGAALALRRL